MLRNLKISALFSALFLGYIVPHALLTGIAAFGAARSESQSFSNLWLSLAVTASFFLCPVLAGYLAARLARTAPLLHGFVVSIMGAALFSLLSLPLAPADSLLWLLCFSAAGVFGAWVWQLSARGKKAEDRTNTRVSLSIQYISGIVLYAVAILVLFFVGLHQIELMFPDAQVWIARRLVNSTPYSWEISMALYYTAYGTLVGTVVGVPVGFVVTYWRRAAVICVAALLPTLVIYSWLSLSEWYLMYFLAVVVIVSVIAASTLSAYREHHGPHV